MPTDRYTEAIAACHQTICDFNARRRREARP